MEWTNTDLKRFCLVSKLRVPLTNYEQANMKTGSAIVCVAFHISSVVLVSTDAFEDTSAEPHVLFVVLVSAAFEDIFQ